MTQSPSNEKVCATSTDDRPVTQTALVATNRASTTGRRIHSCVERGTSSNIVPKAMITAKHAAISSAGLVRLLMKATTPRDTSSTEKSANRAIR